MPVDIGEREVDFGPFDVDRIECSNRCSVIGRIERNSHVLIFGQLGKFVVSRIDLTTLSRLRSFGQSQGESRRYFLQRVAAEIAFCREIRKAICQSRLQFAGRKLTDLQSNALCGNAQSESDIWRNPPSSFSIFFSESD